MSIPNAWCEKAPAFTLREVQFPWRSTSRRKTWWVSAVNLFSMAEESAGLWPRVFSLTGPAHQGLGLEQGDAAPASLVLDQQLFTSPQGSSKIATAAPSSQRRQKLFCLGWQNEAKSSKDKLYSTTECLGREALKNAHKITRSSPTPQPHTHLVLGLKNTAAMFWAQRGGSWKRLSLQDMVSLLQVWKCWGSQQMKLFEQLVMWRATKMRMTPRHPFWKHLWWVFLGCMPSACQATTFLLLLPSIAVQKWEIRWKTPKPNEQAKNHYGLRYRQFTKAKVKVVHMKGRDEKNPQQWIFYSSLLINRWYTATSWEADLWHT